MTKNEVLEELAKVGAARRGQISEQWYTVKGKDGQQRRQGPYYVWTWCEQGKKHTARIPARDIEKARAEIEKGKDVERLVNEFWRNAEATAQRDEKKTAGMVRSKPVRRSAKPSL